MRKILLFCWLVSSAAYAQGPHGGVTIVSTGLKVDSAVMTSGKKIFTAAEFSSGAKVYISLMRIHGFSIRDGKSFPGVSMRVTDSKKKTVLEYEDLFAGDEYKDGVSSEDARVISVNLTIGSPMETGQTYQWEIKVWDKVGGGSLTASVPVKVVLAKDELGIKKTSGGLNCESAYILSGEILTTNKVKEGQKLTFVFTGMTGYKVSPNKRVNIGAQLILKNQAGKNVVEYADLFKDQPEVDVTKARTLTMYFTVGDPIMAGESYTWIVKIWDKGNNKWLEASVPLDVMEE